MAATAIAPRQANPYALGYGNTTSATPIDNFDWAAANTPQQHGYGVAPVGRAGAYQTTPGLAGASSDPLAGARFGAGAPGGGGYTWAPSGFDQRSPGVGEQFQNANQGRTQSGGYGAALFGSEGAKRALPGASERYWEGVSGGMNRPSDTALFAAGNQGRLAGGGASAAALGEFRGVPTNLDPYYERAIGKAQQDAQNAAAATGMVGSTANANRQADVAAALRAEQAGREAEYQLAVAQTRGNLAGAADAALSNRVALGANMAGAADAQRFRGLETYGGLAGAAQGAEMAREGRGVQDALAVDQMDLARYRAGLDAALAAQGLNQGRAQTYADNLFRTQAMYTPLAWDAYGRMIAGDQELMNASLAAEIGLAENAVANSYRAQERHKTDAEWGEDRVRSAKELFVPGGSFFGGGG